MGSRSFSQFSKKKKKIVKNFIFNFYASNVKSMQNFLSKAYPGSYFEVFSKSIFQKKKNTRSRETTQHLKRISLKLFSSRY